MKLVCNVSILALFTVFNIAVAEDKNLESQKAEGTARKCVDAFISGDLQTLIDHASPELKSLVKDVGTLGAVRGQTIGNGAQPTEDEITVVFTRLVKSTTSQAFSITATVSTRWNIGRF